MIHSLSWYTATTSLTNRTDIVYRHKETGTTLTIWSVLCVLMLPCKYSIQIALYRCLPHLTNEGKLLRAINELEFRSDVHQVGHWVSGTLGTFPSDDAKSHSDDNKCRSDDSLKGFMYLLADRIARHDREHQRQGIADWNRKRNIWICQSEIVQQASSLIEHVRNPNVKVTELCQWCNSWRRLRWRRNQRFVTTRLWIPLPKQWIRAAPENAHR